MTRRRIQLSGLGGLLVAVALLPPAGQAAGIDDAVKLTAPQLQPPSLLPQAPAPSPSAPPSPPQAPQLPIAPSAPRPAAPTPRLPSTGAPPAGTTSPGATGSGQSSGATSPGAPSQNGAGAAPETSSSRADAFGGGWAIAAGNEDSRRKGRAAARQRRFEQSVEHLSPCFYALGGFARRVLVLRAGLGRHGAHSRGATAKRLGTSSGRVARAERRGLRELRQADRSDGCASREAASGIAGVVASDDNTAVPALQPIQAADSAPAPASEARAPQSQDALGARASSPEPGPPSSGGRTPVAASHEADGGSDAALWAGLAALLMALLLASVFALRRRRARGSDDDWELPPWLKKPRAAYLAPATNGNRKKSRVVAYPGNGSSGPAERKPAVERRVPETPVARERPKATVASAPTNGHSEAPVRFFGHGLSRRY